MKLGDFAQRLYVGHEGYCSCRAFDLLVIDGVLENTDEDKYKVQAADLHLALVRRKLAKLFSHGSNISSRRRFLAQLDEFGDCSSLQEEYSIIGSVAAVSTLAHKNLKRHEL